MLFPVAPGRSPLHPIRFHPPVARDFHARGEEKPCCALGRATLVGFYDWQRSQVDTGLSSCASRWGVAMAASSGQFDPGGVRVLVVKMRTVRNTVGGKFGSQTNC